jgi:hypothetical protein
MRDNMAYLSIIEASLFHIRNRLMSQVSWYYTTNAGSLASREYRGWEVEPGRRVELPTC